MAAAVPRATLRHVAILLAAVLAFAVMAPAPAHADESGSVAFEFLGSESGSAEVLVCPAAEREGPWASDGCAPPTWVVGTHAVVDRLPPGTYVARVRPTQPHQTFFGEWWRGAEDRASATSFEVAAGGRTPVVWELRDGASLTGTVRDARTREPVDLGLHDAVSVTLEDTTGRQLAADTFTGPGPFQLHGMRTGRYVLRAAARGYSSASTVVDLVEGETRVSDLHVAPQGTVSGAVVAPGDPDPFGRVEVIDPSGAVVREGYFGRSTTTESAVASFEIPHLEPGAYRLRFTLTSRSTAYPTWLGRTATSVGARTIEVRSGAATDAGTTEVIPRASLPTGKILISTTGPDREPVDDLRATVYDRDGFAVGHGVTDRGVTSSALPAGRYRVFLTDRPASLPGYHVAGRYPYDAQWWGGTSLSTATHLAVSAGATTTAAVRVSRTLPGDSRTVSGRATAGGVGMPGVRVSVNTAPDTGSGGVHVGYAYTDDDGRYRMRGLPPGAYRIVASDDPRWRLPFSDVPRMTGDGRFDVRGPDSATVDIDLGTRVAGAVVRGRVIGGDTKTGLPGLSVRVTTPTEQPRTLETDSGGWFEFEPWYPDARVTFTVTGSGRYADRSSAVTLEPGRMTPRVVPLPLKLAAATPTLPRTVKVGTPVKAGVRGWTTGTTFAYQWKRDGVAIRGATMSTYTPVAADRGTRIAVTVTGSLAGYAPATRTSASRITGAGTLRSATPTITGVPKVGRTLTALRGAWSPGATYSYRWYADGEMIRDAVRRTLTLTTRQAGDVITVKVTARKSGYTTVSRTSARTARVGR